MGIGNLNTLCKVLPPSNRVEAMPLNAVAMQLRLSEFNLWMIAAVSYTHLDVYKRQDIDSAQFQNICTDVFLTKFTVIITYNRAMHKFINLWYIFIINLL